MKEKEIRLTAAEVRFLISLLSGEAARQAASHDRHAQVTAELLRSKIAKLQTEGSPFGIYR